MICFTFKGDVASACILLEKLQSEEGLENKRQTVSLQSTNNLPSLNTQQGWQTRQQEWRIWGRGGQFCSQIAFGAKERGWKKYKYPCLWLILHQWHTSNCHLWNSGSSGKKNGAVGAAEGPSEACRSLTSFLSGRLFSPPCCTAPAMLRIWPDHYWLLFWVDVCINEIKNTQLVHSFTYPSWRGMTGGRLQPLEQSVDGFEAQPPEYQSRYAAASAINIFHLCSSLKCFFPFFLAASKYHRGNSVEFVVRMKEKQSVYHQWLLCFLCSLLEMQWIQSHHS